MFSSPLFRFFAGTDVFLSYRWREDSKRYALQLTEELEKRGLNCFIDEKGLSRGEVVPASLRAAIRRSRMFVMVAGDDLDSSTWIPKELAVAQEFGRKIVPVNIDGTLDRLNLDDSRWAPLKDRSRVEETAEALAEHVPSKHVPVQIDEAYDFTRVRVKGIRLLFLLGVVFFGLSIGALASAFYAVRVRNNARTEIGKLTEQQVRLSTEIAQALKDKKAAEDGATQAIHEKNTAIDERAAAIGDRDTARKQASEAETKKAQAESDARVARADAVEQTKLGADQLRLKGYVSALAAGDRTSAMLSIRDFITDDKTEGWKDAAVSVLQNAAPVWQADEAILGVDRDSGRFLSYTSSRDFVIRWLADPHRFIQLGGTGPVVGNGFDLELASITWSRTANFVAVSLRLNLGVWNLDHPEKPILIVKDGFLPAFSPHSNLFAVANGNAVEFWRLGDKAEQVAHRDLGGGIWGIQWLPDRETVACVVKQDKSGKQEGLFEVGLDHQIKLADGDYLINYSISPWQQLLTKSLDEERRQTIYRVKPLASSGKEFELRLPGLSTDLFMNLFIAGDEGHFVLVHSRGSLWLADLRKPNVAPVEISKQLLPQDPEFQSLLNDKLLVSAKDKGFVSEKEVGKLLLFDLNNPDTVHALNLDPKRSKGFAVSPDGNWFATPTGLQKLSNGQQFNLPSGELRRDFEIEKMVFSPDSDRLLARLKNSELIVIDLNNPNKLQTIDQPGQDDPLGPPFVVWGSSKTGELMTMAEGNVRLWKLNSRAGADVGDLWYLFPRAVSSSGNMVWLGGGGIGGRGGAWSIESWQATQPAVRRSSIDVSSYIEEIAVNEQQTAMVAITGVPEQQRGAPGSIAAMVRYWTMNNATDLHPVKIDDPVFESASLSRDSLRVIGIRKNVPPTIWEPPFEKPVITLPTKEKFRRGFLSSNGRFAALLGYTSSAYDLIEVWDLSSPQPTRSATYTVPRFGNMSFELAVSNNGRTVVSYGAGLGYEFSEAAPNGKPLRGSENGTRHLEFSPSDQKIIATLYSGQAVLWNVDQPESPELVMSSFSTLLGLARFATNDNQVITVTSGRHIQVWDISSSGLRQALNQTAPLCMTFSQREKYFGLRRAIADEKAALCK